MEADSKTVLEVLINGTKDVDLDPMDVPIEPNRESAYYVVVSLDPHALVGWSAVVACSGEPRFDTLFHFPIEHPNAVRNGFLKIEVVRAYTLCHVGTSIGQTVVGRARVPLQEVSSIPRGGWVKLVRWVGSTCKYEGLVQICVLIKKLSN